MLLLNDNRSIINEVYFGKTPSLQKIEKQLDKFRSKYLGKVHTMTPPRVNQDQDLFKFNRMIEEEFGFGCFSLQIIGEPIMNAFTMPIDMRIDVLNSNKHLIADKNSFKFNKDADYSCIVCIYSGIIFNPEFTTSEVMACILHEIGHNFSSALYRKYGLMSNFYCIMILLNNILAIILNPTSKNLKAGSKYLIRNTNTVSKMLDKLERYLRKNDSLLLILKDWHNAISDALSSGIDTIVNLIDRITLGSLSLSASIISGFFTGINFMYNPLNLLILGFRYRNERMADNFATIYGYGSELTSFLNKLTSANVKPMQKSIELFNNIPIISHIYNFNLSIANILNTAFDEHPDGIVRAQDQIDLLNNELQKEDLDPKMRNVIRQDIKACQKQIDNFIDLSKGIKDRDFVRNIFNKAIYKSGAKGDAIFDDNTRFKAYDKTYEEKRRN